MNERNAACASTKVALFIAVGTTVLAGCAGGGSLSNPPLASQGQASAAFVIVIPSASAHSATARSASSKPQFVDAATQSLSLRLTAVNGAPPNPAPAATVVNLTSQNCTAVTGGKRCTADMLLPIGSDTIAITAYGATNAAGNALSAGQQTSTVSEAGPNGFSVALGGVVNSITLTVGSATSGTPATVPVTVVAKDAAGTQIVGSDAYTAPIALSDSDASGVTKLSSATVSSPATVVSLQYNGGTLPTPAVIAATASGIPTVTAKFQPGGGPIVEYTIPTANSVPKEIRTGPDGNLWFVEYNGNKVAKLTTSGAFTE